METRHAISRTSLTTRLLRNIARAGGPFSRPLAGRRGFRVWAVVRHQGRRSGAAYATPVAIGRTRDGFVVPIPFGDATQWVRNVQAAGGCTVRWNGRDFITIEPQIIDRAAAFGAFPRLARPMIRMVGLDRYLRLRDADPT